MMEDDVEDVEEETALLEEEEDHAPGKRGVNALQLTMMIYFFTSGGPFGIEPAIAAGGPFLTFICITLIPLVWSLPQALLSAELSLMTDVNGGNVVWVQNAFGDFGGWFNAYNCIISSFASMSTLVILFVEYIPGELAVWEQWLIKIGFVLFITILNVLGLRWISRLSVFFLIFILSPFVAEVILFFVRHDYERIHADKFFEIPPLKELHLGVLLSTVVWSYGGFDSMGSLAGEVKGGRPTFIKGIIGSMPLIIINYYIPLITGYAIRNNWRDWPINGGYFTDIAFFYEKKGWLGYWMVASSALSNFGQYNAAMAPLSRVVWAMARFKGKSQKLPSILAWSHRRHTGTIRPVAAILFTGLMSIVLCGFEFNYLVQVYLSIRIINLFWEYAALIKLRYSQPDSPRPFVVPGGLPVAWVLGVPTMAIAGVFYFMDAEVILVAAATNIIVFACYLIFWIYRRHFQKKKETPNSKRKSTIN